MFDIGVMLRSDGTMLQDGLCDVNAHLVTAGSYYCPHCSYQNACTFDAGHSGDCHCDQGHYWSGNH